MPPSVDNPESAATSSPAAAATQDAPPGLLAGHNILCIGPDLRAHTDRDRTLRIMRRLARHNRVHYIDTITAFEFTYYAERRLSFRRLRAGSLGRPSGVQWAEPTDNLSIYRPGVHDLVFSAYDPQLSLGEDVVRQCALSLFQPTLLWLTDPQAFVARFWFGGKLPVVYHVTDDLLSRPRHPQVDYLRTWHRRLVRFATVVLCESAELYDQVRTRRTQGVHWLPFPIAARRYATPQPGPPWVRILRRPLVGFWGDFTPHHNGAWIVRAAQALPEVTFCVATRNLAPRHKRLTSEHYAFKLPNVRVLPEPKPDDLAGLLQAFDVCLLPLSRESWLGRGHPPQLLPYLATGRPLVATKLPHIERLAGDCVYTARSASGFVAALRRALAERDPQRAARRRALAAEHDWDVYLRRVGAILGSLPIKPVDPLQTFRCFCCRLELAAQIELYKGYCTSGWLRRNPGLRLRVLMSRPTLGLHALRDLLDRLAAYASSDAE